MRAAAVTGTSRVGAAGMTVAARAAATAPRADPTMSLPFDTVKNRLPMPDVPAPPVPVTSQKIVCTPLVSVVVSNPKMPSAVLMPG